MTEIACSARQFVSESSHDDAQTCRILSFDAIHLPLCERILTKWAPETAKSAIRSAQPASL